MKTVQKTGLIEKAAGDNRFKFVLSDETPDRDGDVIKASGWDLGHFKKNPIALAYHDATKPVGKWHNLKVVGGQLTGELELAPDEVGPLQRAINSLVNNGFLKAVSVGFQPVEHEPRKGGGINFLKQALMEISLVSVPSNPNALAIAKACDLSENQITKIFDPSPVVNKAADSGIARARAAIAAAEKLTNYTG